MNHIEMFKLIFQRNEGYVCLAYKKHIGDKLTQSFFHWPDNVEEIDAWVRKHKSGNCYFCPHLLSKPIRQKKYALSGYILWADLDACNPVTGMSKYVEWQPNIIVKTSKRHYQGYWFLDRDIEPQEYEALNHRIALAFKDEGCDQSGWDLTQLLRLPGTTNNKGKPFEVIAWKDNICLTQDGGRLPPLPSTTSSHKGVKFDRELPQMDINSLRVSRDIKQLILEPPDKGERSETCFRVIAALHKAGYSATEVKAIMKQNPIGGRYYER